MVLDAEGNAALIALAELQPGFLRTFAGVKVVSTGEVARVPPAHMSFPEAAPFAHPIFARTHFGVQFQGRENALVWNIGWSAANGFSVPSRKAIDLYYELSDQPSTHLSV